MLGKRLARLVLAPGALPYGVLALVLGLIWLGVGTRSGGCSQAEPVVRSGGDETAISGPDSAEDAPPIGLSQALESARRFAGAPGLQLEGDLQSDPLGGRRLDFYYLETLGPTRGEDFFKVDARSGEVIEATFRSRLAPTSPPIGLRSAEAEQAAARYAHDHFFGFDELRLVERSSRTSENNILHSFKWSQIAPESGAELPVSVSIAVSAGSGEVVWYLAQRETVQVDVRPAIDRGQALRTAAGGIVGRDARWDTESPSAIRLQVLYDEDDQQQLVWSVTFRSRQDGPRPTLRLLVNAHTGQLIAGPS